MSENLRQPEEEQSEESLQTGPNEKSGVESEQKDFPVICSWCGKETGRSPKENSHGICKDCKKKALDDYRNSKKQPDQE